MGIRPLFIIVGFAFLVASPVFATETSLLAHWIRDEIREIAPHLYLGKVYLGKKRLIDFVLEFPPSV